MRVTEGQTDRQTDRQNGLKAIAQSNVVRGAP